MFNTWTGGIQHNLSFCIIFKISSLKVFKLEITENRCKIQQNNLKICKGRCSNCTQSNAHLQSFFMGRGALTILAVGNGSGPCGPLHTFFQNVDGVVCNKGMPGVGASAMSSWWWWGAAYPRTGMGWGKVVVRSPGSYWWHLAGIRSRCSAPQPGGHQWKLLLPGNWQPPEKEALGISGEVMPSGGGWRATPGKSKDKARQCHCSVTIGTQHHCCFC